MLFWFIISIALTAVMPNTVSRAVARLQLTSLRVALIGLLGTLAITIGVVVCLLFLPEIIGALISILALLLVLVATLFGRVAIFAATGRWLQRRLLPRDFRRLFPMQDGSDLQLTLLPLLLEAEGAPEAAGDDGDLVRRLLDRTHATVDPKAQALARLLASTPAKTISG